MAFKCKKLTRKHVTEAQTAYADAGDRDPTSASMWHRKLWHRKLMWQPKDGFSPRDFRKLAEASIPRGYNAFNATRVGTLIEQLAPSACTTLSREHSPAVYLRGPQGELQKVARAAKRSLRADEVDFVEPGVLRLWWD